VSDPDPVLVVPDCLVCHHQGADRTHEAERGEGRDRESSRDEGEQDGRPDRPSPEDSACRSQEECDVSEQVECGASAEADCGHRAELVAQVAHGGLEAEGEEDDAGDHR